jgi:hypothetical protein
MIPAPRFVATEPTDLDPRAVQVLDGPGCDERTIVVTRPGDWAGPACGEAAPTRRAAALADYAVHLAGRPDLIALARTELAGHDLGCACAPGVPCHRDILLDVAQPPADPYRGGHGLAVTLARPWASLVVLPEMLSRRMIHTRSWCTDYRGALCVLASRRLDEHGVVAAAEAGFDAAWHARQRGWLGVGVLVDVHRAAAGCCGSRTRPHPRRAELYHWVWEHGARLARPVVGPGFLGLRPVAWSVLIGGDTPNGR